MYCPDAFFKKIQAAYFDASMKTAFWSVIFTGLLSHGYMFANKLPNYDDIEAQLDNYGGGIDSGRWMLSVLGTIARKTIHSISLPWFNGILCLILMGITACLIVRMFEVRDRTLCAITGAVLVSFPTLTGIFFFMFTSVYYCIAILWSVMAVFCARKANLGTLTGMILLASALGIYQSYFALAGSLMLLLLIRECLKTGAEWKKIFFLSLRYLALLTGALVFYFAGVKFFLALKGVAIGANQGIDKVGSLPLTAYPGLVLKAYQQFFTLFYRDMYDINPYWVIRVCLIFLTVLSIGGILKQIRGKNILLVCETLLFLGLFPLAVDLIYVMAPDAFVYSIMMYSVVTIYFLPLCLDRSGWTADGSQQKSALTGSVFRWLEAVLLAVVIFCQCQYNNVQYTAMQMQYEQAYSYWNTLITKIKSADGYQASMDIALIGNPQDPTFYQNDEFTDYNMGGRTQDLVNIYCREKFLYRYMGFQPSYTEELTEKDRTAAAAMPPYPNDGSIKINGDTVLVKFSELD